MQNNEDKERSTNEVQSKTQYQKKIAAEARFSASIHSGPGAHSASCTMGTESFPGVKRPELGVNQPPLSSTEVKEIVELYLYSPSGVSWPVLARTFTFLFPHLHLFLLYYFIFSRITLHFCLSFFIYILAPLIPLPFIVSFFIHHLY